MIWYGDDHLVGVLGEEHFETEAWQDKLTLTVYGRRELGTFKQFRYISSILMKEHSSIGSRAGSLQLPLRDEMEMAHLSTDTSL